jgi:hypothetical protein
MIQAHGPDPSQSGNVFFYLFLAVALFGSLTFVVAQGNRGSVDGLTKEQARLNATEIIDFGDTIARATGSLRLRGTRLAQLRFSDIRLSTANYGDPALVDPVHAIFNPDGGAVIYRSPPTGALRTGAGDYDFIGNVAVRNIGTDCASAQCVDLLMLVPDLNDETCRTVNVMLNIHNREDPLPAEANFIATGYFNGTLGYADTIGDEAGSAALAGRTAGCFRDTAAGINYYYRVLWTQ